MTLDEIRDEILDFLDDMKLKLGCLGYIPLELILTTLIGGIAIVSHIWHSPIKP